MEKGQGHVHDRERAGPGPQPLDLAFEGLQAHRVDGANGMHANCHGRPVQRQWCQSEGTQAEVDRVAEGKGKGQLHVEAV